MATPSKESLLEFERRIIENYFENYSIPHKMSKDRLKYDNIVRWKTKPLFEGIEDELFEI